MALIATLKVQEGPRGKANIFDMKAEKSETLFIYISHFLFFTKAVHFFNFMLKFSFQFNLFIKNFQHLFVSVIFKVSLGIKTGVE